MYFLNINEGNIQQITSYMYIIDNNCKYIFHRQEHTYISILKIQTISTYLLVTYISNIIAIASKCKSLK